MERFLIDFRDIFSEQVVDEVTRKVRCQKHNKWFFEDYALFSFPFVKFPYLCNYLDPVLPWHLEV